MKNLPVLKFLIVFSAFFAFSALEIKASSFRSPSVREIKFCIEKKEADFGEMPSLGSDRNSMGFEVMDGYVTQLSGLIGCVNQGLKIPNLSWRVRRDWLIKRFEYYQMRQIFAQYSCYVNNAKEVDKFTEATESAVEKNNKKAALRNVNLLQISALRTKECIDRGARFKHIDPEFKEGFRAISTQTDGLLEKVEGLRAAVKKMPE